MLCHCTFIYYLDLSIFISGSGLSYFRVSTICLLLVYFVSTEGCHCFDFPIKRMGDISHISTKNIHRGEIADMSLL